MSQGRIDKTVDKMRRGGLPAPANHTRLVGIGDGMPCDGCGEAISSTEVRITATLHQALDWWFHEPCYDAWATFER